MEYAKHAQLNLDDVLSILNQGAASSWQSIHNGPLYIQEDLNPGSIFTHFLKDLRCVMHEANLKQLQFLVVEKITSMVETIVNDENQIRSTIALVDYYKQHQIK